MDTQQRGRSKPLITIVTLFIVAVLVAAATLGFFWYRKTQTQADDTASTEGGNISLAEKVETEKIQTALVIPAATDKVGDTINVSTMSITTPKAWRTLNAKNLINTPLEGVYATSQNDILAQLVMVPEKQPTDPIQAINNLSIYNATSWLTKPSLGMGGTVTSAAKVAYLQNLANLGDGKPTDPKACDKAYGILNPALCGTMLAGKPIATADGKLKGVVFINTTMQSVSYDPVALVFLTGKVKDQQLFAYGAFHLLDNASHQLSIKDTEAIKTTWEDFAKGNVPSDTLELYDRVTNAIKSITIQAN